MQNKTSRNKTKEHRDTHTQTKPKPKSPVKTRYKGVTLHVQETKNNIHQLKEKQKTPKERIRPKQRAN